MSAGTASSSPKDTSGATRTSRRAPKVALNRACRPSVVCGVGIAAYGTTTTRAAPPLPSRSRRWKYGSPVGSAKRRARHPATTPQPSASTRRGTTTASASVRTIRWIHGAAGAPVLALSGGKRKAENEATSGSAIPDSAEAGASAVVTIACAVSASRNVLSQPTR